MFPGISTRVEEAKQFVGGFNNGGTGIVTVFAPAVPFQTAAVPGAFADAGKTVTLVIIGDGLCPGNCFLYFLLICGEIRPDDFLCFLIIDVSLAADVFRLLFYLFAGGFYGFVLSECVVFIVVVMIASDNIAAGRLFLF